MIAFSYTDERGRRFDVEFGFLPRACEGGEPALHCRINGQSVSAGEVDRLLESLPEATLDVLAWEGWEITGLAARGFSAN